MKKTLVWLLALLLTAALPASAAERFEVTDGVYVALPDVFVAYTRGCRISRAIFWVWMCRC